MCEFPSSDLRHIWPARRHTDLPLPLLFDRSLFHCTGHVHDRFLLHHRHFDLLLPNSGEMVDKEPLRSDWLITQFLPFLRDRRQSDSLLCAGHSC